MNMRPVLPAADTVQAQAMLLSVAEERDATSVTRTMTLEGRRYARMVVDARSQGPVLAAP